MLLRVRRPSSITGPLWDQFAALRFAKLEQLCLEAYDRIVGLDLDDLSVDGCIVKAPCGGEMAGRSPVDRGKQGTKRSLLTDAGGIPLGCVA